MIGSMASSLLSGAVGSEYAPYLDIAGGLVDVATGDIIGGAAPIIANLLGMGKPHGDPVEEGKRVMEAVSSKGLDLWKASAENMAGYTGSAAEAVAQSKLNQLGDIASAVSDAHAARRAAESMADTVTALGETSKRGLERTSGRMLNEAMRAVSASRAPASAISSVLSKVGDNLGEAYSNLYAQSLAGAERAAQARMQAASTAQNILQAAKQAEFAKVQPYLVKRADLSSLIGSLTPSMVNPYLTTKQANINQTKDMFSGTAGTLIESGSNLYGLGHGTLADRRQMTGTKYGDPSKIPGSMFFKENKVRKYEGGVKDRNYNRYNDYDYDDGYNVPYDYGPKYRMPDNIA